MQRCKMPPLFHIQEEENLGLTAQFDIAEFSAIISRLCMDRHSAVPNTPNSSSLPTPTLVRFSPRSWDAFDPSQSHFVPPYSAQFVYYTNINAGVPVLILTCTNDIRYNHKPVYLFWRNVPSLIGASEVNRPESSLRITVLLCSSEVDIDFACATWSHTVWEVHTFRALGVGSEREWTCKMHAACGKQLQSINLRGIAEKSLARPGRKQTSATKLGMYSTYSPRSSIQFLALCSNFCKPLKKKKFRRLSVQTGLHGSNDLRVGRKRWPSSCFFSPGNMW